MRGTEYLVSNLCGTFVRLLKDLIEKLRHNNHAHSRHDQQHESGHYQREFCSQP
jgi:hypothetical protein